LITGRAGPTRISPTGRKGERRRRSPSWISWGRLVAAAGAREGETDI